MQRLNNMILNKEIKEKIKQEIKNYLEINENENIFSQNMWMQPKQF